MIIEMINNDNGDPVTCRLTKEKGDPTYHTSEWGTAESRLLYHVKNKLNAQGHDLIKKRAWKDGHLVDDHMLYLRSRHVKNTPYMYIYNPSTSYDAGEEFNKYGTFDLKIQKEFS